MAQCKLSDRQRDLLRVMAQGLQQHNGPVRWWIRMAHDHSIPQWQHVEDADLLETLQRDIMLGDVAMFERCGFIVHTHVGRYDLVSQRILDAVESDFFAKADGEHRKRDSRGGRRRSLQRSE